VLSDIYIRVKRTIFINNQVRRYYGKKYYRQTSSDKNGGTQERLFISQARANQKRVSESEAGIGKGEKAEIGMQLK